MKQYLQNWNVMRLLRLAMGILTGVQGLQSGEWLIASLGGLFSITALLNVGCGSTAGCSTSFSASQKCQTPK